MLFSLVTEGAGVQELIEDGLFPITTFQKEDAMKIADAVKTEEFAKTGECPLISELGNGVRHKRKWGQA